MALKLLLKFISIKMLSTLAEAAMLAGIPKSPNYYSPLNNLKASQDPCKMLYCLKWRNMVISTPQKRLKLKMKR